MTSRLKLFVGAAAALAVPHTAFAAEQAAYPMKPVRMIVPVAPGGGADITARALAQKLTEMWGQQVIIDNRAGAGGIVGWKWAHARRRTATRSPRLRSVRSR